MGHYLLSVYTPSDGTPPTPTELEAIMNDVEAFNQELRAAGAWVFSGGLEAPDTATVVRLQEGGVLTTDGPFLEAKEYLGGLVRLLGGLTAAEIARLFLVPEPTCCAAWAARTTPRRPRPPRPPARATRSSASSSSGAAGSCDSRRRDPGGPAPELSLFRHRAR
jgi:hypothetical protein